VDALVDRQQGGMIATPAVAGLLLAWWGRRWAYTVLFVALAPLKLVVEWLVIRQPIGRGRMWKIFEGDVVLRGETLHNSGFLSGHATTAMAFLPIRWRWLPVLRALRAGIARLHFAPHNSLDRVGGFAIGVAPLTVFQRRYVSSGEGGA
jgi:membrane-associated phospholipid phosphatase